MVHVKRKNFFSYSTKAIKTLGTPSLDDVPTHLISTASAVSELVTPLDTQSLVLLLIGMAIGLVLSAFFSSSEIAFFSVRSAPINGKPEVSTPQLDRVNKLLETPRRLLSTILIGNTIANVVVSVLAAVLTGKLLAIYEFPTLIIYGIEVILVTFLILILSEITPKYIAIRNPISLASRFSMPMLVCFYLFKPFSNILAFSTQKLEDILPKPNTKFSAEDIKAIAEVGEQQGSLEGDEREIIENVIEFGNISVKEIMTSRVDIVAIGTDMSFEEGIGVIKSHSLSRMPLYHDDLDGIVGTINAKDLLPYLRDGSPQHFVSWEAIARKPMFVPMGKKIDDLLKDFQREKTHMAFVVDEYGGTEGLVTLDDVLEEIVGELTDDSDGSEQEYIELKNGTFIFDAKIDLDEVSEVLDAELTTDDDEYETLGGLIYHILERIPVQGEKMEFNGFELTAQEVVNNRVSKIKVKKIVTQTSAEPQKKES